MRRTLLAVAAVALLGGLALMAVSSLGSAPRVAGSAGAQAASGAGGADEPVASGPFALAAQRAAREGQTDATIVSHVSPDQDERGYVRRWHDHDDDDREGRRRYARHLFEIAIGGLADRLDVDGTEMRSAVVAARSAALADGDVRDRSTWDERKRAAVRTLARVLDRPAATVESATGNQLEHSLSLAVAFDLLTAKGRDLALACWDVPQRCQVTALRLEILVDRRGAR